MAICIGRCWEVILSSHLNKPHLQAASLTFYLTHINSPAIKSGTWKVCSTEGDVQSSLLKKMHCSPKNLTHWSKLLPPVYHAYFMYQYEVSPWLFFFLSVNWLDAGWGGDFTQPIINISSKSVCTIFALLTVKQLTSPGFFLFVELFKQINLGFLPNNQLIAK